MTEEVLLTEVENVTLLVSDGTQGPSGASAYQLAVKNGFIGSEAQWLESLNTQGAMRIVILREAGEALAQNTPVVIVGNKAYAATCATHPSVDGVVMASVEMGFAAEILISGEMNTSGLSIGKHYLGEGVLTTTPVGYGYLQEVGFATASDRLVVDIKQSFLLS